MFVPLVDVPNVRILVLILSPLHAEVFYVKGVITDYPKIPPKELRFSLPHGAPYTGEYEFFGHLASTIVKLLEVSMQYLDSTVAKIEAMNTEWGEKMIKGIGAFDIDQVLGALFGILCQVDKTILEQDLQDIKAAVEWLKKSAEAGNPQAQRERVEEERRDHHQRQPDPQHQVLRVFA